jgi:multidrug efflux pump subunit AcrA (membrane-fusion protein)
MTLSFPLKQLKPFPLFKGVDLALIESRLAKCSIKTLIAGDALTVGDGEATTFYLLLQGCFVDSKKRRIEVGQTLGADNLLQQTKRSYVVTAASDTELLVITEDNFWQMVSVDQQLVRNIRSEKQPDNVPEKPKLSSRLWLIGGAVVLFSLTLIYSGYHHTNTHHIDLSRLVSSFVNESKPVVSNQQDSYRVQARPVTDWLHLKGSVQPTHWTDMTSPIDSVVTRIHFRFGDLVEKGQLLAELSTTNQRVQQRERQTAVIKAKAQVAKLLNWKTSIEVTRAKRELVLTREALKAIHIEVNYSQRLFDKGIISKHDHLATKEMAVNKKISVLSAIDSLKSALLLGDATQLKLAKLQLLNAEQHLKQISEALNAAKIHSPTTGVIFPSEQAQAEGKKQNTNLYPGVSISKNQLLFAIADMVGIAIESDVSEKDVSILKLGQAVKVKLQALPNMALDAVIDQIAGRGVVSQRKGSLFKVRVVVKALNTEQRSIVRIGMSADARVVTYHNDKALVVPFTAVTVKDKRYSVNKLNAQNQVINTPVTIRSTLVDGIEIKQGVAVGDQLVIGASTTGGNNGQ